jgi:hypothetical protein
VRRWPLRILICLILLTGGAITTVAVAWGIFYSGATAYGLARNSFEASYRHARVPTWYHWSVSTLGWESVHCSVDPDPDRENAGAELGLPPVVYELRLPPRWTLARNLTTLPELESGLPMTLDGGTGSWTEHGLGWPAVAMASAIIWDGASKMYHARDGVLVSSTPLTDESRLLPLRVVWPGFAIDTLFYAAIWGGAFFGFASAKRAIRRKRGRCPRCGYDLRGGVMSDERLAISGEEKSATFKPQASGLKPAPGCPECGWNRMQESAP